MICLNLSAAFLGSKHVVSGLYIPAVVLKLKFRCRQIGFVLTKTVGLGIHPMAGIELHESTKITNTGVLQALVADYSLPR